MIDIKSAILAEQESIKALEDLVFKLDSKVVPTSFIERLKVLKKKVAFYSYVYDRYGNVQIFATHPFRSKKINKEYDSYHFEHDNVGLYLVFHRNDIFTYDGVDEHFRVYSNPPRHRLAYTVTEFSKNANGSYKKDIEIRFNKYKFHWKTNEAGEKLLLDCKKNILEYSGRFPGAVLNTKNLDSKIQKLLMFK